MHPKEVWPINQKVATVRRERPGVTLERARGSTFSSLLYHWVALGKSLPTRGWLGRWGGPSDVSTFK